MRAGAPSSRPRVGLAVGFGGVLVLAVGMIPFAQNVGRVALAMLLVVPVVAAARLGGRIVALGTAALAALAFALYLPPVGSPLVRPREDIVALAVFAAVAGIIGAVVAGAVLAERRHRDAEHARSELLQAVDAQRQLLLRSVSHDLRTPLATIRTVAAELRSGASYDAVTRDEMLDLALDEVDRLDRIVANLLSLSRIEAGSLQPDRQVLEIDALVGRSVRRLRQLTRSKQVEVRLDAASAVIVGDASQIDQVITNILENAVRASRSRIEVGSTIRGDEVEIYVEDDGPGISADMARELFVPFVRRGGGGLGIGLAICRALVEANGGTVRLVPSTADGARFSITFPRHD